MRNPEDTQKPGLLGMVRRACGRLPVSGRVAGRVGGVLRSLAGSTAGWRQTRRGSFLVIVVGTLALMSVLAVVYIAIGRSDSSQSQGLKKAAARDDVPMKFGDYLRGIVANDVLATTTVGEEPDATDKNSANALRIRQESNDYPFTKWERRTSANTPTLPNGLPNPAYFTPWGEGDDPWIAANEPTFYGPPATGSPPASWSLIYPRYLDWSHVSNVAPDGAFVNLANLRNAFNATPFAMRKNNSLVNIQGQVQSPPATDFGTSLTLRNGVADAPGELSNRQRFLFNPGIDTRDPGDWRAFDNMFADADGDGLKDSRWQEMSDARDLVNGVKYAFDTGGKYRYFFATRVIDLSGMVNITTATDLGATPTWTDPLGTSPADVDLLRLFMLEDVYRSLAGVSTPPELGYGGLEQSAQLTAADNYKGYNAATAAIAGSGAYKAVYDTLKNGFTAPPLTADPGSTIFTIPTVAERAKRYFDLGGLEGTLTLSGSTYSMSGLFTMTDMLDLLTRRATNDPEIHSNLEAMAGGRVFTAPRFSPLRENRGLDLELDGATNNKDNGNFADLDKMAQFYADARQRLTVVSSARPLSNAIFTGSVDTLNPAVVQVNVESGSAPELFKAYGSGLLPDGSAPNAWDNGSPEYQKVRFQHYGKNPLMAVISAAQMAANLAAAKAGGYAGMPYTVLLDEQFRNADANALNRDFSGGPGSIGNPPALPIGQRRSLWSWWAESDKQLDLNPAGNSFKPSIGYAANSPLADSGNGDNPLWAPAVNVYGVTAQPVLTAAASFSFYTDAPSSAGGDKEWYEDPSTGDVFPLKVTIDGSADSSNSDFLGQIVAFQLTNPFERSIQLTGADVGDGATPQNEDRYDYYFEYGGRYYRVAALDADNATEPGRGVSLGAGKTMTFFATSSSIDAMEARWRRCDPTVTPGTIMRWVTNQLSVTGAPPVWIEEMNFAPSGKGVTPQRVNYSSTVTDILTPKAGASGGPDSTRVVKLWRSLRAKAPSGSTNYADGEQPDTGNLTAPLPVQYLDNDQLVDRIRVPVGGGNALDSRLPSGNNEVDNADAYPESDSSPGNYNKGLTLVVLGSVERPSDPDGTLNKGVFPAYALEKRDGSLNKAVQPDKELSLRKFLTGPDNTPKLRSLTFGEFVTDQTTGTTKLSDAMTKEPNAWLNTNDPPANVNGTAFKDLRVAIMPKLDNGKMRLADVLLPLAIGPMYNPYDTDVERRHLTLSEALAAGLGYEMLDAANPYFEAAKQTVPGMPGSASLDRGRLNLDGSAPFFDDNGNGVFDRGAGATDLRKGLGIPHALAVLDRFNALDSKYGNIDRGVQGKVNINTAPLAVLRTLGLLSPTSDTSRNSWMWSQPDQSDIAATLLGYRDKITVDVLPPSSGAPTRPQVSFRDSAGVPVNDPKQVDGRWVSTAVDAVREQPGLRSIGEVLLAKQVRTAGTNPPSQQADPGNIDFLGYRPGKQAKDGVSSGKVIDVKDQYAERLMVANSMLNAASVRSDVFAAWFIVRGYQKSDVERSDGTKIPDAEPVVPTIERRFLMIMDRSNVKTRGDLPKVLLFKEVPLK